jgi:hypothetical protein
VPTAFPPGPYPDVWYQGRVSFSDVFYEVDTETGFITFLLDPQSFGQAPVDAIGLQLNGDATRLLFTNKKDYTLWAFDLPDEDLENASETVD